MASNPVTRLTEQQYLDIERAAEIKSEFLNGEMFAMSGASVAHSRLQGDLIFELYSRLRNGPCEVLTADVRVKIMATGLNTYPDLTVVCGPHVYSGCADDYKDTLVNPTVLFEVLSPSTESYVRGAKFDHYSQIESLKDYVLVAQSEMRIEQRTRGEGGTWTWRSYSKPEQQLTIESIGVSIPLSDIYRRVNFNEPAS